MKQDKVYEALCHLYLRLNGYFTTGLILHSPKKGELKGELDCIAVRLKNHSQDTRGVQTSPFLDIGNHIVDVLICEVKTGFPTFNQPMKERANVIDALKWVGAWENAVIEDLVNNLMPHFEDAVSKNVASVGVESGGARVRALLCTPAQNVNENRWILANSEIFDFVDKCLNYRERPLECNRKYSLGYWGQYNNIVSWFKNENKKRENKLNDLVIYMANKN